MWSGIFPHPQHNSATSDTTQHGKNGTSRKSFAKNSFLNIGEKNKKQKTKKKKKTKKNPGISVSHYRLKVRIGCSLDILVDFVLL